MYNIFVLFRTKLGAN